jgi:hypothetical protein
MSVSTCHPQSGQQYLNGSIVVLWLLTVFRRNASLSPTTVCRQLLKNTLGVGKHKSDGEPPDIPAVSVKSELSLATLFGEKRITGFVGTYFGLGHTIGRTSSPLSPMASAMGPAASRTPCIATPRLELKSQALASKRYWCATIASLSLAPSTKLRP